tara:strand:- start:3940 stop:4131 length:192 start_codon:yes stop_codon:yes gene_type:complete
MSFVWLKDLNNNVRQYKENDTNTINALITSGRWMKIKSRRDLSDYIEPKKVTKKPSKKAAKKK